MLASYTPVAFSKFLRLQTSLLAAYPKWEKSLRVRHRRLRIPYHPTYWTLPPLSSHATNCPARSIARDLTSLDGTTSHSTTVNQIWVRNLTPTIFNTNWTMNLSCQRSNSARWEVRLLLLSFELLGLTIKLPLFRIWMRRPRMFALDVLFVPQRREIPFPGWRVHISGTNWCVPALHFFFPDYNSISSRCYTLLSVCIPPRKPSPSSLQMS